MITTWSSILDKWKSTLVALLIVIPLAIPAATAQEVLAESADTFFDVSFGDLQEELSLVAEENKLGVLVMFETEDCPWCTRMKQTVLNRVTVQDYYHEYFRVLSIDAEGDVPVVDFDGTEMASKDFALKSLRVRATPVFVFFDKQGNLVTRYTGVVKNAHDFLLLGRFVVEGHHETQKFNQFRRENQPG